MRLLRFRSIFASMYSMPFIWFKGKSTHFFSNYTCSHPRTPHLQVISVIIPSKQTLSVDSKFGYTSIVALGHVTCVAGCVLFQMNVGNNIAFSLVEDRIDVAANVRHLGGFRRAQFLQQKYNLVI